LAGLSGTIISNAQLQLFAYNVVGTGIYSLYEVSAPPATVSTTDFSTAIYHDLGTGTVYGTIGLNPTDSYNLITIPLTADAIAAIQNAEGGVLVLAGC